MTGDFPAEGRIVAARRRRRVYVSSTYSDLVDFRRKVAESLGKIGYEVIGMEGYVATDARPVDKCLADVRSCEVYVGLFAWRYGFIPPGYDRSITELEYREATKTGKERLIFLTREDASWPVNKIEQEASGQVARLRKELGLEHMVGFFTSPDDLATEVTTAITASAQRRAEADVDDLRAQQAEADRGRPQERQRVVNLPPVEASRFVDRLTERDLLRSYFDDPTLRMVKVVGRAGMGKSAVASRVLAELEAALREERPGAEAPATEGLLYLSARSTGLSLERLQADTLRMLGEEERRRLEEAWQSNDATVDQKVSTLLAALRAARFVIVLDAADAVVDGDLTIVEPGLRTFVEACLRQSGAPLLVLTSRVDVLVPPDALAAVRSVRLEKGLPPEHAVELLRALDPQGELGLREESPDVLERAATITGGIPRALEVLVGILQRDPSLSLRQLLEDEAALGAQTVEGLIAEGYRRLDDDERRVMHALAVLGRPAATTAVAYLLVPWFPGVDVRACLRHLVSGYFVTGDRRTGEFVLQALDRDHAYRDIADNPPGDTAEYGRTALELRAADFYASVRKSEEQWLTLDDIGPQLAEFEHCVRAGAYDRALEVLDTVDEHHLQLWGHFLRLIQLRTAVLDKPVRPDLRAANMASLGTCYQVLGEYDEAVRCFEEAVRIAHDAGEADAEMVYVGNLGRVYRHLGLMDDAIRCLEQTLGYYEAQADRRGTGVWAVRVAYAYFHVGRVREAIELGTRAVELTKEVGDRRNEGAGLSNLGLMYQVEGQLDVADAYQVEALEPTRAVGDRRGEAIILGRLGGLAFLSGDHAGSLELHTQALALADAISDRREQSYQLLGLGRALAAQGDFGGGVEKLEAARGLDVPETSYLAALSLSIVLLRRDLPAALVAFNDTVRRCRERLSRSNLLYGARYALGTALLGIAASGDETRRDELVRSALEEYRQALHDCPGRGVIAATVAELDELGAAGATGLDPARTLLRDALSGEPPVSGDGA